MTETKINVEEIRVGDFIKANTARGGIFYGYVSDFTISLMHHSIEKIWSKNWQSTEKGGRREMVNTLATYVTTDEATFYKITNKPNWKERLES